MGRKKLLYVTRPLAGGMFRHIQSLLNYFPDRWDVSLAAPAFPFSPELQERLCFYPFPLEDGLDPWRDLHVLVRLLRICRETQPDLMHIHGFRAAMVGLPVAWLFRCPAVVTVHNFLAYPGKSLIPENFFRRVVKFLDPAAAGYIAVSGALRDEVAGFGIPLSKILRIYNGIDPGLFADKPRREPERESICRVEEALVPLFKWRGIRVGTAGRLVPQKGFDLFIRAAAEVAKDVPGAGFFIAGEGPERRQLEDLRNSLGMEKRVFLLGEVKAMPDFLSSLDLFVLASRSEGLSISLLEAGSAGVPRIAAATGGIPEIICHGKTGLLFPPEDVAALAREMLWLALRPQQRAKLGKEAAAEVMKVSTEEKMLQETEKVYKRILEKKKSVKGAEVY